jgi:hypothetical protein
MHGGSPQKKDADRSANEKEIDAEQADPDSNQDGDQDHCDGVGAEPKEI